MALIIIAQCQFLGLGLIGYPAQVARHVKRAGSAQDLLGRQTEIAADDPFKLALGNAAGAGGICHSDCRIGKCQHLEPGADGIGYG